MEEFLGRYRNLSVLLAAVFAQIILLGYQVRSDSGSSMLREWTVRSIAPVTKGVRGITQWFGSTWDDYFWLIRTEKDNQILRRQLAQLKLENSELRTNLARFEREDKLIDYQRGLASQTILAQVIGKGANSNSKEIFISRGLDAGVTAGMPVITPDGIVGKVQASYPSAALVMLISDPEAGVGVLLGGSRAAGILKGTGHAQCRLDYVGHEVEVAIGEAVYTSGDDRVFPKGLRIGEVTQLGRGTDFQEIQVKPSAQLDRLEEVLVINKGVHQDLPESPTAQAPQFLMPLPQAAEPAPAAQVPAEIGPVQDPATVELESNGRLTDADRLRQYYQSVAAQQGHRIGYGEPGTRPPDFNAERLKARQAAAAGGAAVPQGAVVPQGAAVAPATAQPMQPAPAPVGTGGGSGVAENPAGSERTPGAQRTPELTPASSSPAAGRPSGTPGTTSAKPAPTSPPGWLMPTTGSSAAAGSNPRPTGTVAQPAAQQTAAPGRAVGDPGAAAASSAVTPAASDGAGRVQKSAGSTGATSGTNTRPPATGGDKPPEQR